MKLIPNLKPIFCTFTFLFLCAEYHSLNAQPFAEILFEKMDYGFGRIKEEGGLVTYEFKFNNTGNIPLVIQGVNASCGCTTPEWSREPVLPGKTGFIKVSFNPDQRPGIFTKSITVNANIPKGTRVLTISGEVVPRSLTTEIIFPVDFGKIRLASPELSFVKIKDNEIKTDTIQIYNPGALPVVVNYKIIPPHIMIKTIPEVIQPKSKGFFLITFDAAKKAAYGYVTNRIYLSFNDEEKYVNAIKVSAIIEEDFSKLSAADLATAPKIEYDSRTFDFGEIMEGRKAEYTFRIMNKGGKDLVIRSVTTSCDCTTGQPASNIIKAGGGTTMKVSFDSREKAGIQNRILTVISNDPANSTTILRVTGTVKR
jgi:LEA14-like dessication related protein